MPCQTVANICNTWFCCALCDLRDPKFAQLANGGGGGGGGVYLNTVLKECLSYDVAPGSKIMPCNKICKPLVVYRFQVTL